MLTAHFVSNIFTAMALFVNNYGVRFIFEPMLSVIPTFALIEGLSKLSIIGKKCRNQCNEICDNEKRKILCQENPDCCRKLQG